ncbi:ferredoxin reductase [Nitriliruptor alkaliphilus]|uniref:ferredoxin reductase n=1 Tax=Nitriliruptor alkaliphilus TaxID=427918 RepID=UPI0009FA204F|nr:ferredoxin reductase [Nitriliruptor alkaliphilus]
MPLLSAPRRPLPASLRSLLGSSLLEGLASPHSVSRYLESVHPLWTLEGGRAQVVEVHPDTADTVTLTLQPDHVWQGALPGQHVRIGVPIDGVIQTRTYSVSSSAHRADGRFTITAKRKEGGLVSGWLHQQANVGAVLHCSAATGEVVLPDPRPERLLLISGGSGITPVVSMLRTLADEDHTGSVTFLHYARSRADVPFLADLQAIADRLPGVDLHIVPTGGEPGEVLTGRFEAAHLDVVAPDHRETLTFACGPTGLIDALEEVYAAGGVSDLLQVERFTPRALVRLEGVAGGTIRFERSGIEVTDDGRSLLEQAEAAGLAPENGCRMGICHTCTRFKPEGAVTDLRDGRVNDTPDARVQICVTVPAGDVVLDL